MTVAVVTGGNSGIGRASAVSLARIGFDVGITWHREEERAQEARREIEALGRRCALRQLDLERAERGQEAIEALADERVRLRAGLERPGPYENPTLATLMRRFGT